MLKKFTATALVVGMLILPSCSAKKSNYQTYSDNLAKRSLYHDTAKKKSLKFAFEALNKIMGLYEKEIASSLNDGAKATLFKYTAYDKTGEHIVGTYEVADVTSGYVSIINNMTITNSRERVIREFAPIFEDIATGMVEAGNPPKSWIDVASEFVKHVPLMASMGAMYGLTTLAIDKAGNNITANLSDNAAMRLNNTNTSGSNNNIASDGATVYTQDNDTSVKTRDYSNDTITTTGGTE